MTQLAKQMISELMRLRNSKEAVHAQKFFKTGKGEYGEGDLFLGIRVPVLRRLAKQYCHLDPREVEKILRNPYHEQRLLALLIWTYQFSRFQKQQSFIYRAYMRNTLYINNWDLVDVTCPNIVGMHLLNLPHTPLYIFAKSKNLWKKRIAIISTFSFIRRGDYTDTIKIATMLLRDSHDLIHKAVGWMLREVGKRDLMTEKNFLEKYASVMPRTMLRYAIEKFPKSLQKHYLQKRNLSA